MFIQIDPATESASLADPANFGQFHVAVPSGGVETALAVLGSDGAATDQPGNVWVSIAAVKGWAAGQVDEDWDVQFDKMLDYAAGKGWLDADGTHIQAHIEAEGD